MDRAKLASLLETIVSEDFAAEVSIASSFAMAQRIARRQAPVRALVELVRESPIAGVAVMKEIDRLMNAPVIPQHVNENDAAILALGEILAEGLPFLAFIVGPLLCQVPQSIWASELGKELADSQLQTTKLVSSTFDGGGVVVSISEKLPAGFSMIGPMENAGGQLDFEADFPRQVDDIRLSGVSQTPTSSLTMAS